MCLIRGVIRTSKHSHCYLNIHTLEIQTLNPLRRFQHYLAEDPFAGKNFVSHLYVGVIWTDSLANSSFPSASYTLVYPSLLHYVTMIVPSTPLLGLKTVIFDQSLNEP